MATVRSLFDKTQESGTARGPARDARLLFYIGVPVLTALLFALNKAGMSRHLPGYLALPYWVGLTIPLWLLLDGSTRVVNWIFGRFQPHRWLVLLGGSLLAMALFSPYVMAYAGLFRSLLPPGTSYLVETPFPEAFLDLRRFVAFSGVPIYWMVVASFFARYLGLPSYLVNRPEQPSPDPTESLDKASEPALNDYGLPVRQGFLALTPYHLGTDLVSLRAEDHYVRVVTDKGSALIRYRFADALTEVRRLPGIQVHRSHWVAVRSISRVRSHGKGYQLTLSDGTDVPVSRTNIGLLRAAGLV